MPPQLDQAAALDPAVTGPEPPRRGARWVVRRWDEVRRFCSFALLGLWLTGSVPPAFAAEHYGPVQRGETLWQIAGRVYQGEDLSRDQIMLALLRANPDAFTPSCNVNAVLHTGVVLRLPPPEQVAAVNAESARRAIQQQGIEWTEHRRSGRPLVCPPVTEAPAEAAPAVQSPPAAAAPTATPGTPGAKPAAAPPPAAKLQPETGEQAAAAPCPPQPATAVPAPAASPVPELLDGKLGGEESGPPLPPGPRAPAWALSALLVALLAAAMIGWERRQATVTSGLSATAALEAAAKLPKRAALLLTLGRHELHVMLLLSALGGFLGALVTVVFREGIHGLEWLFGGHAGSLVVMAESLPAWKRLLLPPAGGLVAGLILQQIGSLLRGRSTTDYMEAVAVGDGWISVRHSLVKSASSLFTVASGGSIGREGAMVQLAAMVGSALGRISRFPRDRLRLLVAAGAAAGLASAYNAPIAATIFVAEIVLGSIALEHIGPLIIAAVIANATVHDILGYAPVYQLPSFRLVSDWELGLYVLLGLAAGHVAPFFLTLLERAHHLFRRLPLPLAARMALGGLLVGAISVYEPQVWGNGYSVVNSVLHTPWAWQALLTVLVLKMLATAATHGSGAVGGAFTPTLFVGALLGSLFGTVVHNALPAGTAPPNAYGVVGMGAMLAGTTHAPLMSILMVLEMTMEYQIVLPLMLAIITAHYTARRYTAIRPMYADALLPREEKD
jgi:FimV-like protein